MQNRYHTNLCIVDLALSVLNHNFRFLIFNGQLTGIYPEHILFRSVSKKASADAVVMLKKLRTDYLRSAGEKSQNLMHYRFFPLLDGAKPRCQVFNLDSVNYICNLN